MNKPMRAMAIFIGLVLSAFLMTGCGNGSNSGNINGNWNASLTNTDGSQAFAFTTTFTEASNGGVDVTNFSFNTAGSCFANQTTSQSGSFGLSGNFNGNVAGTFGMTISTTNGSSPNSLKLQGTVNGGTITGTWTLSGSSACSGNGNFTMNRS